MSAFLCAALRPLRALRWRTLFALEVLGQCAILVESTEDFLFGTWFGHPSLHYASMALNVLLLIPVGLVADALVARGARERYVYTTAVFATWPVAFLSTCTMEWLYLRVFAVPPGVPNLFWKAAFMTSNHLYIYGAFALLVYFNQRMADRLLENFRDAELRRVTLEQQLAASRLAAAEAQVDPRRLFDDLARIRGEFADDAPGAEDSLNDLIQSLRTAMGRTREVDAPRGEVP